jgi:hypothetical protein
MAVDVFGKNSIKSRKGDSLLIGGIAQALNQA